MAPCPALAACVTLCGWISQLNLPGPLDDERAGGAVDLVRRARRRPSAGTWRAASSGSSDRRSSGVGADDGACGRGAAAAAAWPPPRPRAPARSKARPRSRPRTMLSATCVGLSNPPAARAPALRARRSPAGARRGLPSPSPRAAARRGCSRSSAAAARRRWRACARW